MEQSLSCGTRGLPGLPVLLLGGFVTVFDLFVVNVAAPVIQRQFAADFSGVGLIVAGYELAFGVLLIAGGRLGDRFGRRRMFSLGMLGFALTSALCGAASSLGMLIVARFLQGAAAALLFPQIYALLRVLYNPHQRRRAFAWLGMTLGLAAIFGQILGGFIIEANVFGSGWRMIFLINLPIGGLALLAARRLPESRLPQAQRLDGVGLLLAASGLLLLLVPLLEGRHAAGRSGCGRRWRWRRRRCGGLSAGSDGWRSVPAMRCSTRRCSGRGISRMAWRWCWRFTLPPPPSFSVSRCCCRRAWG
nr:MFS transporter [Serratia sp. 1D1416]